MQCPNCGSPHVSVEFDEAGLINECVECESRWKNKEPANEETFAHTPPVPRVVATKQSAPQPKNQVNPKTLIQQAKARVSELDREIKKLTRLVQERDELKRLLAAAKTSGEAANVRPLRAASRG